MAKIAIGQLSYVLNIVFILNAIRGTTALLQTQGKVSITVPSLNVQGKLTVKPVEMRQRTLTAGRNIPGVLSIGFVHCSPCLCRHDSTLVCCAQQSAA